MLSNNFYKETIMKNKVLVFCGQNRPAEHEINEAVLNENKEGWRVVAAETSLATFGKMGDMPLHMFYTTTITLQMN